MQILNLVIGLLVCVGPHRAVTVYPHGHRARIDGEIYELDDAPDLELHKKHNIEVVVDRFKVRADMAQRLAESFETALSLADGVAYIAFMDDPEHEDLVFSANFACPVCGYSISELEPWRTRPVVVHCYKQGRSRQACRLLLTNGFEQVLLLRTGIDGWSCEVDPSVPRY